MAHDTDARFSLFGPAPWGAAPPAAAPLTTERGDGREPGRTGRTAETARVGAASGRTDLGPTDLTQAGGPAPAP